MAVDSRQFPSRIQDHHAGGTVRLQPGLVFAERAPTESHQPSRPHHGFDDSRPLDVSGREQEHQRRKFPAQILVTRQELLFLARVRAPGHDQFLMVRHTDLATRETVLLARVVGHGLIELDVPSAQHASGRSAKRDHALDIPLRLH